ncbi:hypothetical protein HOY82DRAFT_605472 [Tuber indicum]|nr:hypothetical protein HOY82DRAFT_605472 [Tuber indicum]
MLNPVLALNEIQGSHTGAALAEIVVKVVDDLATEANFIDCDVIAQYPPEAHLAHAAHLGLSKLRCYGSKIREISAYLVAVVLDPRQKWDYFELSIEQGDWTQREVEVAWEIVQQLWVEDYKESGLDLSSVVSNTPCATLVEQIINIMNDKEEHHRQWQAKRRRITSDDAYTRYIQSPLEPNIDLSFQYWVKGEKSTNPLARMALDIFSIAAMYADPER